MIRNPFQGPAGLGCKCLFEHAESNPAEINLKLTEHGKQTPCYALGLNTSSVLKCSHYEQRLTEQVDLRFSTKPEPGKKTDIKVTSSGSGGYSLT